MNKVYERHKGKEITFNNYSGFIAGWNHEFIILATRDSPTAMFKKLDKTAFVEDIYKNEVYNYVYSDERTIEKHLGIKGMYGS